jgi:hypothetical protein
MCKEYWILQRLVDLVTLMMLTISWSAFHGGGGTFALRVIAP